MNKKLEFSINQYHKQFLRWKDINCFISFIVIKNMKYIEFFLIITFIKQVNLKRRIIVRKRLTLIYINLSSLLAKITIMKSFT